jgi:hypothetical protein
MQSNHWIGMPLVSRGSAGYLGAAMCFLAALAGCGGGGHSGGGYAPPVDAVPGGIWLGTNPRDNSQVLALVTETGEFLISFADGVQYDGAFTVSGDYLSDGRFYAEANENFYTETQTGTLTGSIVEGSQLTVSTVLGSNGIAQNWFLPTVYNNIRFQFQPVYFNPSSLALIQGTYVDDPAAPTATLSISGSGAVFGQDSTGCAVAGQVSIIDPRYNLYAISLNYPVACSPLTTPQSIDGVPAAPSGVGYAFIDYTQTPNVLFVYIHTTENPQVQGSTYSFGYVR